MGCSDCPVSLMRHLKVHTGIRLELLWRKGFLMGLQDDKDLGEVSIVPVTKAFVAGTTGGGAQMC